VTALTVLLRVFQCLPIQTSPATVRKPLFLPRIPFKDLSRRLLSCRSSAARAPAVRISFSKGLDTSSLHGGLCNPKRLTRRPGLLRNSVRVDSEVLCLNESLNRRLRLPSSTLLFFQSFSSESKFILWKAKAGHGTVRTKAANHFQVSV